MIEKHLNHLLEDLRGSVKKKKNPQKCPMTE